jgi:Chalcone isomerase-like
MVPPSPLRRRHNIIFPIMKLLLRAWLVTNVGRMIACAAAMKDKATGIAFAPRTTSHNAAELEILGVGVRKKGPIKVYSVGMYGPASLKAQLGEIRGSANAKGALRTLRDGAKADGATTTFVLEMSYKVGAEKMAKAIADSVGGRYDHPDEVQQLKTLIAESVAKKGAATVGTKIQFNCSGEGGVEVAVDGQVQGRVGSKELAAAMCDVYLDDNCVSPALRKNILETNCM